ncbi:MAG: hypothetical protein WBV61_00485 [Rhodanobacteraceae bacterium]
MNWMDRTLSNGSDIGARVADASHNLLSALRDANHTVARQGAAGWNSARDLGSDLISRGRNVGKSTTSLIAERPLESVLIVGLAGLAIGWVLRRAQESRTESRPAASKSGSRARKPRRKTASR